MHTPQNTNNQVFHILLVFLIFLPGDIIPFIYIIYAMMKNIKEIPILYTIYRYK